MPFAGVQDVSCVNVFPYTCSADAGSRSVQPWATRCPIGPALALALGEPPPDPPVHAVRARDAVTLRTATVIARARLRVVIRT
ncbi:hypothetical protein GCM10009706_12920 [Curtobacterium citreum]|nr:hypothetical protein GCM10009706_12920 [Curtobacterium citreum]